MVKTHVEESLGANPGDAALNPADSVAMGVPAVRVPGFLGSSRGRAFRALVHRPFRLFFAAFLVNQTGFWISFIAMQGLMAELSGNDPVWLGRLFFALFIPAFALAPLAGVAADRFDRKRIMLTSYATVAGLTITLAGLTATGSIDLASLLLVALGMGTSFAFAGPASFAVAVNTVPDADMPSAVSLQSAANNLTRVIGPMVAAPFLAASHFDWAFICFAAAAVVASLLVASMRVERHASEPEEGGIVVRITGGLQHARERRPALPALLMVSTLSLFGVSHSVLLPVFAEEVLGSVRYFAWIVVATGAGAMLGALSIGYREARPSMPVAAVLMLGYGASLAAFALTDSLAVVLIAQFVIGWTYFAVMTSLQTLIQQIVHETKRGRVMSLFQVAWAGLIPWGGLAMGAAAGWLGVTTTLECAAAICGIYAVAVLIWSRTALPSGSASTQSLY